MRLFTTVESLRTTPATSGELRAACITVNKLTFWKFTEGAFSMGSDDPVEGFIVTAGGGAWVRVNFVEGLNLVTAEQAAARPAEVELLEAAVSASPTQAEVQAIADKVDELITALKA